MLHQGNGDEQCSSFDVLRGFHVVEESGVAAPRVHTTPIWRRRAVLRACGSKAPCGIKVMETSDVAASRICMASMC